MKSGVAIRSLKDRMFNSLNSVLKIIQCAIKYLGSFIILQFPIME